MTDTFVPKPKKRTYDGDLVLLFAKNPRVLEVAAPSGLSVRTVSRWKARPENWAKVEALRGEVLQDTLTRLRAVMPALADELAAIVQRMNDLETELKNRIGVPCGNHLRRVALLTEIAADVRLDLGVTTDEDRDHFHRDHRGPRDRPVSRGRFSARSDSANTAQGRSARR